MSPTWHPRLSALQYDVKLANGLSCGGAYLKFLTADEAFSPAALKDDTPYTVMFGPDKCGSTNKVGFHNHYYITKQCWSDWVQSGARCASHLSVGRRRKPCAARAARTRCRSAPLVRACA